MTDNDLDQARATREPGSFAVIEEVARRLSSASINDADSAAILDLLSDLRAAIRTDLENEGIAEAMRQSAQIDALAAKLAELRKRAPRRGRTVVRPETQEAYDYAAGLIGRRARHTSGRVGVPRHPGISPSELLVDWDDGTSGLAHGRDLVPLLGEGSS